MCDSFSTFNLTTVTPLTRTDATRGVPASTGSCKIPNLTSELCDGFLILKLGLFLNSSRLSVGENKMSESLTTENWSKPIVSSFLACTSPARGIATGISF